MALTHSNSVNFVFFSHFGKKIQFFFFFFFQEKFRSHSLDFFWISAKKGPKKVNYTVFWSFSHFRGVLFFFPTNPKQGLFFQVGYTGFVPQKFPFWGTCWFSSDFHAKIWLISPLMLLWNNEIYFSFYNRQLTIEYFVFSVVLLYFVVNFFTELHSSGAIYWLSPKKRGKHTLSGTCGSRVHSSVHW